MDREPSIYIKHKIFVVFHTEVNSGKKFSFIGAISCSLLVFNAFIEIKIEIVYFYSLLCGEGKQGIESKSGASAPKKKIAPHLMSGVTFHYWSLYAGFSDILSDDKIEQIFKVVWARVGGISRFA